MDEILYSAIAVVAVVAALVALGVWTMPVLQLLRWIDVDEARMKIFWSCAVFGLAYGAAFGSLCGPSLWVPTGQRPLSAVAGGVIDGALLGAFGGGVTGFVGTFRGRRTRWWLAGVLGSAAPAGCLWIVSGLAAAWEPAPLFRDRILSAGLWSFSATLLIGGCLGAAVDSAVRSGRSIVPGVQRLAAIINRGIRPEHVL